MREFHAKITAYQNFPVDAITASMPLTSSSATSCLDSLYLKYQVQYSTFLIWNQKQKISNMNVNFLFYGLNFKEKIFTDP